MIDVASQNPSHLSPSSVELHYDSSDASFDIVKTYTSLLRSDPLLPPPIAAIDILITLLSSSPASTVSETLSLLSKHVDTLKASVANPIAVSAGTDLFQRYLISTLQPQQRGNSPRYLAGGGDDFQAVRNHLIANGKLFLTRAKEARPQIASLARRFIRDDTVVLTLGNSRVVEAVLSSALAAGTYFRLVYVSSTEISLTCSHATFPQASAQMPVAVISANEVAHALQRCSFAIVGAEAVMGNGGVMSGNGTYQLAVLAKAAAKHVYVVAESFKFVREFLLGQEDVRGETLRFSEGGKEADGKEGEDEGQENGTGGTGRDEKVDYIPPELITAVVTETGLMSPSAVSEELIKIWY